MELVFISSVYPILKKINSKLIQTKKSGKKKPKMIGGKLLADGWWGRMQHPNYLGDMLIGLGMSLPCGIQLGGYFYPIYLTTLLIHRQMRDDKKCSEKYGTLWKEYCKDVPYKILPGVY